MARVVVAMVSRVMAMVYIIKNLAPSGSGASILLLNRSCTKSHALRVHLSGEYALNAATATSLRITLVTSLASD